MNKLIRRNFIVVLLIILAISFTMTVMGMNNPSKQVMASDITAQDFYITGASVRAKGTIKSGDEKEVSGIRFNAQFSSKVYALIGGTIENGGSAEFGMLYILDSLRGDGEELKFPIAENSQIKYYSVQIDPTDMPYLTENNGNYSISSYLYNIPEQYYRSQIDAVGYVSITEKGAQNPTTLYTAEMSRSMAEVAYVARIDGFEADYIDDYIANGTSYSTDYEVSTAKSSYALKVDMVKNANDYTYTIDGLTDEILRVRIGKDVINATINANTITIANAELAKYVSAGENTVSIYTASNVYNHTLNIITSEITSETGLKALVDETLTADNEYDYYLLKNDITIAASSWKPIGTFIGTFDGNGKTISGLKVLNGANGQYGGLFNYVKAGNNKASTIKNLAIVGAEATDQGAVLAGKLYTNVVIDNVFINITSLRGSASGIAYSNFATTTVKNVTVYIESATTSKYAMFANSNSAASLQNCVIIDGPKDANGNVKVDVITHTSGYTAFNSFVDYCIANAEKTVLPNGLAKTKMDAIVAEKGVVLVTEANVKTTLYNATEGYLILAEDIDFASDALKDFAWQPTSTFTGTFDGNGYAIKNLTPSGGQQGLFKKLGGSAVIKNLVMTGITVGNQTGAIAYRFDGNITIENVFIQATAKKYTTVSSTNGCGVAYNNFASSSTFTNLIIVMDSLDCAAGEKVNFLSNSCNTSPKLKDCYFIAGPYKGTTTYVNVNGTTKIASGSTYKHFADNAAFNSAIGQTVTLNAFLSSAWNSYNK